MAAMSRKSMIRLIAKGCDLWRAWKQLLGMSQEVSSASSWLWTMLTDPPKWEQDFNEAWFQRLLFANGGKKQSYFGSPSHSRSDCPLAQVPVSRRKGDLNHVLSFLEHKGMSQMFTFEFIANVFSPWLQYPVVSSRGCLDGSTLKTRD